MTDELRTREQAAVLALAANSRAAWHLVSQLVEEAGSGVSLASGDRSGFESPELVEATGLGVITPAEIDTFAEVIESTREDGAELVTVLDDEYPKNLRLVYDRPPFLFVRGELRAEDERAIAVVGTRQASEAGLRNAEKLARELAERHVAVVSGLALGIDGAAHRGALDANGRTIAVIGNGIRSRTYPADHAELAERIVSDGGAIVSQFLPDAPPRREHFPLRNRTMSGLALGSVVVEASSTSGARMQARLALEHGKRALLWRDLVTREPWAQKLREHPGAIVVDTVDDVLAVVDSITGPRLQLTLG